MSDAPEDGQGPRKAMSLKDRIAMFNQPKEAAPSPPPKPMKPKTFKWKTSEANDDSSKSTLSLPSVPPPAPSPTPGSQFPAGVPALTERSNAAPELGAPGGGVALEPVSSRASAKSTGSTDSQGGGGSGLSAADARQTAGSLKDRIALLSGLKVDQPGPPGRAPKPWKKKEEPAVAETQEAAVPLTTDNADATVPVETGPVSSSSEQPDIKIDTAMAQDLAPGTDTPGEPTSAEAPRLPRPTSPTDNLANVIDTVPKSPLSESGSLPESATTVAPAAGIALPAMPTRARGPPRKGRSNPTTSAGTSAATSPVAEQSSASITQQVGGDAPSSGMRDAPSIAEIGSPTGEPKAFMVPPAEKHDGQESSTLPPPPPPLAHEPETSVVTGSEAVERSPIKRSSTGLGGLPMPPPTAASTGEDEDDEDVGPAEDDMPEDEDAAEVTTGMAGQSLEDRPEPTMPSASFTAPSRAMPPIPARIDTSATEEVPQQSPSPPSSASNRRSMARPPVPQAFQRAPSVTSPLSGSFSDSFPTTSAEAGSMSVESEDAAGDGEFANPAVDDLNKAPIQPPVSKPFDTPIVAPGSPARRSSELASPSPSKRSVPLPQVPSSPSSRQGSLPSPGLPPMSPPLSRASLPEPNQQQQTQEGGEAGEQQEEHYEDPEAARRQALAKRMAAMGGMNMFGGPGPLRRKPTLPREEEVEQQSETPTSPMVTASDRGMSEEVPASPTRPAALQAMHSYRPPAGAFVLPGFGKPPPTAAPPAIPTPVMMAEPEVDIVQKGGDLEERETEEMGDETVTPDQGEYEEGAEDEEGEMEEEEEEEEQALSAPPPPLPTGRPTRMPPVPASNTQSFIDVDTSTESAGSKRTSMTSNMSAGMGDMPSFPTPPGGGPHTRTISSASRLSTYGGQQQPLYEEPEMLDEPTEEQEEEYEEGREEEETGNNAPPSLPPARPSRAIPALDTGSTGSSQEYQQMPPSPARSASVYSNRSVGPTPMSPTGHGRQVSLSQMSPTSSRRSSANVPTQSSSGGSGPSPGLTHEYLAHLAISASKSKSRDIDGALATVINDIHNQRSSPSNNFGQPVWRTYVSGEKGQSPDLQINGKIEVGCIFSAWDAKFDRGLGRSSLRVGSLEVPHVGIVCEDVKDVKKAKVKVVELAQGRHQVETYKLDDIKMGTVEIRRLP